MPSLSEFFTAVFGDDSSGWVRIARKSTYENQWQEHFFQWPNDRATIINMCVASAPSHDVFYSPALFKTNESGTKDNVKSARVAWCDFDGNVPEKLGDVPKPSIRVQSSNQGFEHWYWILDEHEPPSTIEDINRRLVTALHADTVWDAGRLLRPPGTFNHKRSTSSQVLHFGLETISPNEFKDLPAPPESSYIDESFPDKLRRFEDVIALLQPTPSLWALIKARRTAGYRSEALFQVAVKCAELHWEARDILTVLYHCDDRWKKFKNRTDRDQRLWQIVLNAKAKHPPIKDVSTEVPKLLAMSPLDLLKSEIELKWVWEGLFEELGMMLFTGPSGVGKTQFSMQAALSFILGKKLLSRDTHFGGRIGFLSMEMGPAEVKEFLRLQMAALSEEEQEEVNKRFVIFPTGEPLFLDTEQGQTQLKVEIERHNLDGVLIDSLGKAVVTGLSDDDAMRNLMNWLSIVRTHMEVFFWTIHHHRKASGDNKKPKTLADVFGSQFLTSLSSSVISLWPPDDSDVVEVNSLKIRLREQPKPFYIKRNKNLLFELATSHTQIYESKKAHDVVKREAKEMGAKTHQWMNTPDPFPDL